MNLVTYSRLVASLAVALFLVLAPVIAQCQEGEPESTEQETEAQGAGEKEPKSGETDPEVEEEEQIRDLARFTSEVTVTATRVETDLMDTPVAVSAFEQDVLDQQGVKSAADLAMLVPNMDIATINGQSTPVISMRGVRSTNETELGDPAVGVHLDGVYSPRMQGVLALMFDNERVEVLRGPQGTLFGRNSTVGSINIISAKPDLNANFGRAEVFLGNYNHREFQGMYNLRLSDTFAMRLSGRIFTRDSYVDGYWDPNQYDQRHIANLVRDAEIIAPGSFGDCTDPRCYARTQHSNWWAGNPTINMPIRELVKADEGDFYHNVDEWAYRLNARWRPKDNITLDLLFQQYRNDSAGGVDLVNCEKLRGRPTYDSQGNVTGTDDCSNLFPTDNTYNVVTNVPGKFYLDIKYLRANLNWDINRDLRFVYMGGYEDQARESAQDMEQSLNAWDGAMFFLPGTGSTSWSHEIQFQSYGNKKFNWIAGANYFHEKTSTVGYYDNSINDKAFWDQPDRSTDAWSIFGQGTYSFTNKWHVTLGYRHSDETKEDVGGRTYACNNDNGCTTGWWQRDTLNSLPVDHWEDVSLYPEFAENDNKGSWSHDDWRLGLDFDLNAKTLLYTYLASGFKSGGIGDVFYEINPRTGEEINVRTEFGPEEVLTLEIGFKSRLANDKLSLRGAYFYSDYDDMQYASVGAIAMTERWDVLRDDNGLPILDDDGNPVLGWVAAPIIAYYTQNVPGAQIQGFELEYDWTPWLGGHIFGYASWLDTEITEDWNTKWNYDPVYYFAIDYEDSVDPENPLLQVNLKGNELAVSPPFKFHLTAEHVFDFGRAGALMPWVTFHWEDSSYLTVWNVDKHTDDMDFVIRDEDVKYTDDRRDSWSMVHAGLRYYYGRWNFELYGYNLTDEVVQWWGGAAEGVAKGSFSTPTTYGIRAGLSF
jgi:iron complex outermembrane receptor protein